MREASARASPFVLFLGMTTSFRYFPVIAQNDKIIIPAKDGLIKKIIINTKQFNPDFRVRVGVI